MALFFERLSLGTTERFYKFVYNNASSWIRIDKFLLKISYSFWFTLILKSYNMRVLRIYSKIFFLLLISKLKFSNFDTISLKVY